MAWRRPGDKPLSETMMVSSPTHICVTRPQWVNRSEQNHVLVFMGYILHNELALWRMQLYWLIADYLQGRCHQTGPASYGWYGHNFSSGLGRKSVSLWHVRSDGGKTTTDGSTCTRQPARRREKCHVSSQQTHSSVTNVRDFYLSKFQDIVRLKFCKSCTFPNSRTISVYVDANFIRLWYVVEVKCPVTNSASKTPEMCLN